MLGFQVVACGTCVIVTNDSAMGPTVDVIVSWQVTISYLAFELSDFVVFVFDGLIEVGTSICEHFKGFAIGDSGSSKVGKGFLSVLQLLLMKSGGVSTVVSSLAQCALLFA